MKQSFALGAVFFVVAAMSAVSASDSAYTGGDHEGSKNSGSTITNSPGSTPPSTNSATSISNEVPATTAEESTNAPSSITNAPTTNSPPVSPTSKKKSKPKKKTSPESTTSAKTESGSSTNAASSSVSVPSTNAPSSSSAESSSTTSSQTTTSSLSTSDLKEYADLTPAIQSLIRRGLELTRLNLRYEYGSDDPKNGGMDCSGTVHYLITQTGIHDVPRDAGELYTWAWKEGRVEPVASSNLTSFELSRLKPGDLLFWTGTYDIQRDPPISHVMIYIGTDRRNSHRLMLGASEGRTYQGKSQYGVSVFDFTLPKIIQKSDGSTVTRERQGRFIGYGPIPGL